MHGVSTNQNVCIDLENDLTYDRDFLSFFFAALIGVFRYKNVCIDLENDLTYDFSF